MGESVAKRSIAPGTTSLITFVRVLDVNGSPITGLVFNSTGLLSKYTLPGAASVAITLATQTVTGAYSSGGFVELDATAFSGVYRFDVPNAAIASGAESIISIYGYTGMSTMVMEFDMAANAVLQTGQLFIKKATAVAFPFVMISASDHFSPITGRTVTATRSIDGGAFGACTNAVSEIANGWYTLTLSTSDTNGAAIALRFTATGADDRNVSLYTQT